MTWGEELDIKGVRLLVIGRTLTKLDWEKVERIWEM